MESLSGIKIRWIAPFKLLEGQEQTPLLFTEEGHRYVGVESIEYFVAIQLGTIK